MCEMKGKGLFKSIGLVLIGSLISVSTVNAQEDSLAVDSVAVVADEEVTAEVVDDTTAVVAESAAPMVGDVDLGRQYFEGSKGFDKGGPACMTCHNVSNDALWPGGNLAIDLTDIYPKYGAGLAGWLSAPSFPAMQASYQNHQLTPQETTHLAAFLEHANEVKDTQKVTSGWELFVFGGGAGLVGILILISLLWMKRKKQMVKKDIFERQNKAWDAKH
jgi:hypothetical protein